MKTGFKKPNAIKNQHPKDKPEGENSPIWNFKCPHYDERSSCYVNAGTHYGVGHKQPVGHGGNPKMEVDTFPRHKVHTMRDDEIG